MRRKVVKQGPATLMISLPSKWAEKHNVKRGDEVEVVEEGNTLTIKKDATTQQKSTTIDLKNTEFKTSSHHKDLIRTIIGTAYRSGYDEIFVNFSEDIKLSDIQNRVNLLMGLEVVSSSKSSCVLKTVLNVNFEEFESLFRKFFQIILNKAKEMQESLDTKQIISIEDIHNFRMSFERLHDFLEHMLSKDIMKDSLLSTNQKIIILNLEKLAREYVHLYTYILDNKMKKFSKYLTDYFKDINEMFEFFYNHMYRFDLEDSYAMAYKKNELIYHKGYDLIKKVPNDEIVLIHHLMNIARRIWDMEHPLISNKLLTKS